MKTELKKIFALLLALVLALGLFVGCGNGEEADSPKNNESKSGEEKGNPSGDGDDFMSITIGVSGELGRFLAGMSPANDSSACEAVFDMVFKTDPVSKEIYSDVLTDWTWEDDSTLVLKMRDDIVFSNGEKANAEDLLFSYLSHAERGSPWINDLMVIPEECEVRDETTAALKLKAKDNKVMTYTIYLYDKSWADEIGWDSEEWYKPVGSGPYECVEYVYGDHMTLHLRDEYWLRDVSEYYVDEYVIKAYNDAATLYMALERGDVDICPLLSTDYSRFLSEGGENFNVEKKSTGVTWNILFGYQENPVWKESPEVRKAIAYGVNWKEMGELMMGDLYVPANTFTPADSPLYNDVGTYNYDPDKAIALLKEAGYGPGELTIKTYTFESEPYKKWGEALQYYLDKIGIITDITYGDTSSTLAKWTTAGDGCEFGLHSVKNGSVQYNPTTSIEMAPVKQGVTFGYVDDERFQELFQNLAVSFDLDISERKTLAKELEQYVYDNVLLIPFCEGVSAMGYRTDVFSKSPIQSCVLTSTFISLNKLGLASTWE